MFCGEETEFEEETLGRGGSGGKSRSGGEGSPKDPYEETE